MFKFLSDTKGYSWGLINGTSAFVFGTVDWSAARGWCGVMVAFLAGVVVPVVVQVRRERKGMK